MSLQLKWWKFNKRPPSNQRPSQISAPPKTTKNLISTPGTYSNKYGNLVGGWSLDVNLVVPTSNTHPTGDDTPISRGTVLTNTIQKYKHSNKIEAMVFFGRMPFLTPTQWGDGDRHFYRDTISWWLPTKAKERFICLWEKKTIPRQFSIWYLM